MATHAVILDPEEYDRLKESDDVMKQLVKLASPAHNDERALNAKETIAITFMHHFDPTRSEEWGHVSYCFTSALGMALTVAGQEARR